MELAICVLAVAIAAAFRGITGFGFALIAAVGLSQFYPALMLVPVVVGCDLVLTGLILGEGKKPSIDWPSLVIMLVFGLIGTALGPLVAGHIDDATAKLCIGLVVMAAALISMVKNPPAFMAKTAAGIVCSLLVGFLLSAFAAGGPVIVAWLLAKKLEPSHVRGTLAVTFGLIDAANIILRFAYGTVPDGTISHFLLMLPATLIGYAIGLYCVRKMSADLWRSFTRYGLLFIALLGAVGAALAFVEL